MAYTVAELAEFVGGALHGDGSPVIRRTAPLEDASADSITFVADSPRSRNKLIQINAGAVIVPPTLPIPSIPTIVTEDPLAAILRVAERFCPAPPKRVGIDPRAAIDPTASIAPDVFIGPYAVVEAGVVVGRACVLHAHAVIGLSCQLGDNVEIHPHAVLYPRTVVGDRSVIHSGAVLGGDGFGYRFHAGRHDKIPQLGHVEIGKDVEIGANTSIDRATLGVTRIGDGTKIDNQVMVAHNCRIGRHNILVSQVGIAGSCTTGDYVVMAGKAGVADHVTIGDRAVLGAMAGVFTDVPAGETYLGLPGRPERDAKRQHLLLERIPEMRRQLSEVRQFLNLNGRRGPDNPEAPDARRSA